VTLANCIANIGVSKQSALSIGCWFVEEFGQVGKITTECAWTFWACIGKLEEICFNSIRSHLHDVLVL